MNVTKEFVIAGNATFTVSNNKGEHFTYKVQSPNKKGEIFFAKVLSSPDNYSYMGVLNPDTCKVHKGSKGMNQNTKSVKVLEWALNVINGKSTLPKGYDIQHSGTCGRCGRKLTDPVSIKCGLGPTCRNHK